MNCVRLYIISFFTILAAACSEQAAPDAPQGVKGLWRLNEKCLECADAGYCRGDSAHSWDYNANRPMVCATEIFA